MLVTVDVTQENIDNSDVFSPQSCPIALALKETVREGTIIRVRGNTLSVGMDEWDFDNQIPFQLNSDHEDHDEFTTDGLEPFSFTMRIPAHHMDEYCECNECEPENDEDDDSDSDEVNYDDECECDTCQSNRRNDENDDEEENTPFSSYKVEFQKGYTDGEYLVRDSQGDTVILTVDQIEKLYNASRPSQDRVWASL